MSKHHWLTIRYRPQTSNPRYVISIVSKYGQRVEQGLEDYRLKPLQDEFESAIEDAEQGPRTQGFQGSMIEWAAETGKNKVHYPCQEQPLQAQRY